eukprot:TRINITY_DN195_c0_g1_i1.p2 TRINITY_DN195_c0_g1~~TRINITY_DN195_c0_g1_i1.p2  ORF type:complete len:102 (-),score=52.15 TRINITY_DN195_c0_g1_i1:161-466(-)
MSEINPSENETKVIEEKETLSNENQPKEEEKSEERREKEEEKQEKKEKEERNENEGPVIEVAHPQNMSQHRHLLKCSSVKQVSIFWDENLRYRKSMEVCLF